MVISTEILKSVVFYENKGLFLGKKNNIVSYYVWFIIDGRRFRGVEFVVRTSFCCF